MDCPEQVEHPVGETIQERGLEPQREPRHHHDDGAPHQRPVLHLLPVGEAPVYRACPCQAEVVLEGPQQLAPIREAGRAEAHAGPPTADEIHSAPQTRQDGTGHLPSARGQYQIAEVIHREAHEQCGSAPVDGGARDLLRLPSDPGQPPPQAQREPREHQRDKTSSGEPVLEAFIDSKPQGRWPSSGFRCRRSSAPVTPAALEVHAIVGRHQPDHDHNHTGVHRAHRVHQAVPPGPGRVMHPSLCETLSRARVALPAGPPQVHRMNRRERATRRSDLVIPMATRTVGYPLVTGRGGETMEAAAEILDHLRGQVVHLRDLYRPVTPGACLSRDAQGSGGRGGVRGRALRVHAVAAGARRRVQHPAPHCRAVHAPLKGHLRLDVTGTTGRRHLRARDRSGRVGPMARRTGRHRHPRASDDIAAVHTRHKGLRRLPMAAATSDRRLPGPRRRGRITHGLHAMTSMARHTGGCLWLAATKRGAVRSACEVSRGLLVAALAAPCGAAGHGVLHPMATGATQAAMDTPSELLLHPTCSASHHPRAHPCRLGLGPAPHERQQAHEERHHPSPAHRTLPLPHTREECSTGLCIVTNHLSTAHSRPGQNHSLTPATKARWDGSPPSRVVSRCVAPILSFHVTPM
jgi:hypothetical protein